MILDDTNIVTVQTTDTLVVTVHEKDAVVISDDTDTVVVVNDDSGTLVVTNESALLVTTPEETTYVVTIGAQGPPGPAGSGTGGAIEINFAYGDATPAVLTVAIADKMIYAVGVHVKVPFDGTGAQVTIGDAGDTDRLMTAVENDLANVGSNHTNPAYAYGVSTQLLLYITPGAGATQGSGLVTLYIQQ